MMKLENKERELFDELRELCSSQGFVHAIAALCFRDNTVKHTGDEVEVEHLLQQYGFDRLIRNEISTLIVLCLNNGFDETEIENKTLESYMSQAEDILEKLHHVYIDMMNRERDKNESNDEVYSVEQTFREPIFYAGESSYLCQYRDLFPVKYKQDDEWFRSNRDFSLANAYQLGIAIGELHSKKLNSIMGNYSGSFDGVPVIECFKFSSSELSELTGVDRDEVEAFITSLVIPSKISTRSFNSLTDFNPFNAYPIVKVDSNSYLLFQTYSLYEALYEAPFYWFLEDKSYLNIASKNRGEFTESFTETCLKKVFSEQKVIKNVDLFRAKEKLGEIDILVLYGDRAIVVQAKSKKLTLAARKGVKFKLQEDFKSAVQDSYNQAFNCSTLLSDPEVILKDSRGRIVNINEPLSAIYPVSILSEHYPALSFQCLEFLDTQQDDVIRQPYVMDVFFLDVLTEMLSSPLHFLSYVDRRTTYGEKFLASNELTVLSYHLQRNLWLSSEIDVFYIGDSTTAELDLSFLARREGLNARHLPAGILTNYEGTKYAHLIGLIEHSEDSSVIKLGLVLIQLNEGSVSVINDFLNFLVEKFEQDQRNHDASLEFAGADAGITIHCNNNSLDQAIYELEGHCNLRKYECKTTKWFGICLDPNDLSIRFGINLDFPWEKDVEVEQFITRNFSGPKAQFSSPQSINLTTLSRRGLKTGRNNSCPCGSGLKYKKCCLN